MAADDDFTFKRARAVLNRIPARVNGELKKSLAQSGERFVNAMKDQLGARYSNPHSAEDRLASRRGDAGLLGSFGHTLTGEFGTANPLTLLAYSAGKPYARIQEFGGTITPKRGRFLTIPTAGNLTPAGVTRFPSARDFIETHPGETFFLRPKANPGSLLLMWQKPNPASRKSSGVKGKGEAIPMFFLTKKVTIPPRLGLRKTWASLAPERRKAIGEALQRAVKGAQAG